MTRPVATIARPPHPPEMMYGSCAAGIATRLVWWVGYSVSTLILGFVLLRLADDGSAPPDNPLVALPGAGRGWL